MEQWCNKISGLACTLRRLSKMRFAIEKESYGNREKLKFPDADLFGLSDEEQSAFVAGLNEAIRLVVEQRKRELMARLVDLNQGPTE